MSYAATIALLFAGWLMIQYAIPLSLSYFLLWRDEARAEGRSTSLVHHRHLPTGA